MSFVRSVLMSRASWKPFFADMSLKEGHKGGESRRQKRGEEREERKEREEKEEREERNVLVEYGVIVIGLHQFKLTFSVVSQCLSVCHSAFHSAFHTARMSLTGIRVRFYEPWAKLLIDQHIKAKELKAITPVLDVFPCAVYEFSFHGEDHFHNHLFNAAPQGLGVVPCFFHVFQHLFNTPVPATAWGHIRTKRYTKAIHIRKRTTGQEGEQGSRIEDGQKNKEVEEHTCVSVPEIVHAWCTKQYTSQHAVGQASALLFSSGLFCSLLVRRNEE